MLNESPLLVLLLLLLVLLLGCAYKKYSILLSYKQRSVSAIVTESTAQSYLYGHVGGIYHSIVFRGSIKDIKEPFARDADLEDGGQVSTAIAVVGR